MLASAFLGIHYTLHTPVYHGGTFPLFLERHQQPIMSTLAQKDHLTLFSFFISLLFVALDAIHPGSWSVLVYFLGFAFLTTGIPTPPARDHFPLDLEEERENWDTFRVGFHRMGGTPTTATIIMGWMERLLFGQDNRHSLASSFVDNFSNDGHTTHTHSYRILIFTRKKSLRSRRP